jgi:hypothetical protein
MHVPTSLGFQALSYGDDTCHMKTNLSYEMRAAVIFCLCRKVYNRRPIMFNAKLKILRLRSGAMFVADTFKRTSLVINKQDRNYQQNYYRKA